MNLDEETQVRRMISETVDRPRRASAGPDDIGSRHARLLEQLWKLKSAFSSACHETQRNNDMQLTGAMTKQVPQRTYMKFSPAGDFSWLDLDAVGDYVSGIQMTGANRLGFLF
jgi:hypothetical protein